MTHFLENETRIAAGTADDKRLTRASSIEIVAGTYDSKPNETLVIETSDGIFCCSRADGAPMSDEEKQEHIDGVRSAIAREAAAAAKDM